MRYPSSVRRYRYDPQTEQVVEVPREHWTEELIRLWDEGSYSQTAVRVAREVGRHFMVFDLLHHVTGAVEILLPSSPRVTRILFDDVQLYEARVLDSLGVPYPTAEERASMESHSPGEQAKQEGIHEVLLDLARSGRKDDFMFIAQYEAHLDPVEDDLPEFWAKTRRLLHLPMEVDV